MTDSGRPDPLRAPPPAGDERSTLVGSLERQRRTFAWKCGGLGSEAMRATVGVSTMTLGGLAMHLALIEDYYFQYKLHGRSPGPPWETVDFDADPDWEWRTGAEDGPAALRLWGEAVERSRAALDEALRDEVGLGRLGAVSWPDGRTPSARRILVDLIEEYARHTGHADLIRESVDGLTGEDPDD